VFQHRQRLAEAGIELHRQRHGVDRHAPGQEQHHQPDLRRHQRRGVHQREHHRQRDQRALCRAVQRQDQAEQRLSAAEARLPARVLHGMRYLVRGNREGRDRPPVVMRGREADDPRSGVVVIAVVRAFHAHLIQAGGIQQVAGEFRAGARNVGPRHAFAPQHVLYPDGRADDRDQQRSGGDEEQHSWQVVAQGGRCMPGPA
jgi:hypothetical protein